MQTTGPSTRQGPMPAQGFVIHTRSGGDQAESPYEKPMVLPAHLLDPDEFELIETCMKTSRVFCDLHKGGAHGVVSALVDEPGTVAKSLMENPETNAILSAAQTILDFKTRTARDIEGSRIKSIIDPRLADHVRREALKFVDEMKRAV